MGCKEVTRVFEKSYRYRFYPTDEQKEQLAQTFGCCRYVYNHFLAMKTQAWKDEKKSLNYKQCSMLLRSFKMEFPWLREVSSVCLQQSLRHLDRAFERFFKKEGNYPKFKKRSYEQKASYMKNSFTYGDGKITLAKQKDPLNIRWSRHFEGIPSSLTITRDSAGRYFVSIHVQEEIAPHPFQPGKVGLDLGLTNLITDDHGEVVCNPRFFSKRAKILGRRQRNFSRKQKGSRNYAKARKAVAVAHAKVRDQRQDFLHKLSSKLVNENQVIAIETLRVKNMIKNKYLSNSIADVGWGIFVRFLEYKCTWYGKDLVKVDQFFPSSKLCSYCGYKREHLELSTREWKCPNCSQFHDRDENAAKNILGNGLKKLGYKEKVPWGARDFKPAEFV